MSKDYDREFYDRKKSKLFSKFMLIAMIAFVLILMNMYSTSVYGVSIVEVIKSMIGR